MKKIVCRETEIEPEVNQCGSNRTGSSVYRCSLKNGKQDFNENLHPLSVCVTMQIIKLQFTVIKTAITYI